MRLAGLVLVVCLGLGLIEATQLRFGSGDLAEPNWWIAFWRAVPSWFFLAILSPTVVYASERWPVRGKAWPGALVRHLMFSIPFALAHLGLTAVWGSMRPGALGLSFAEAFGWLVTRYLVYGVLSYGALVGVVHAYRYHREMEARKREASSLLRQLEAARARALEGKLHPHFVFNTLNAITGLAARGDQSGVVETLGAFSELLRATLDDQTARVVPLREEIEFLRSYLAIQEVRFGDRLTVDWAVEDRALDRLVPGLLLQPLVENALDHGIGRSPSGGTVVVGATVVPDGVELRIDDSGPGTPTVGPAPSVGRGIGLDGTRSRLRLLFGEAATLELEPNDLGGATARVFVPDPPGGT